MAGDGRRTRKVNVLYGVFRQISELSVDVESKQKELQRLQQDKSGLEEQLSSLVRRGQSLFEQHKKRGTNKNDDKAPFPTHISYVMYLLNCWVKSRIGAF